MVLDTLREAISKRETFEIVFRFCHTDGHIFPVRMQGKFVSELYQNRYPVFMRFIQTYQVSILY